MTEGKFAVFYQHLKLNFNNDWCKLWPQGVMVARQLDEQKKTVLEDRRR
jgi:hypothetical protein